MDSALLTLAAVFAAIALAPLLAAWAKRVMSVPLPVVEIALGMLIGPAILGLVEPGGLPQQLGRMGLAAIIYIAGYELDYRRISRRQLGWSTGGWLLSLVLAVLAGIGVVVAADAAGLEVAGAADMSLVTSGVFVGIALTSTALSTAMPALRDANETTTPYGRAIVAAGAVGQLAPLLALSVVFGGRQIWWSAIALVVFAVLLLAAMRIAARGLPTWARRVMTTTMHSSGHFAVRLVVFMIAVLAAVSVEAFDVDMLVGAFAAGVLMRQLMNGVDREERELTEHKFQGLAFGLLTPMFFVSTGVAFDLRGLFAQPLALALVPVFVLVMFVARGFPGSLVLPRGSSARDRVAAMFWTGVGLAVVVAVVDIAVQEGAITSVLGSAMVGAGMVSLLSFPTLALAVRPQPARQALPDDAGA
ncbi:sodium/hydrogen exchanger [Xylanimonas cellulosilytica DSM 15894]|uniref:Sodium/hydrogen exchanger n=1 Tax=Xylanimonas cellulosilytica (strain DSM 15894 / JCM 12276 / CECT 5975 / KCTC 9989 / LMG 20990 / NBRC 107835 / XIL07) TaxID=446471 RepID=D1BT17_XYLCX|nr:cation:proton antiporter [Xylanimonas cellulosilytica]ACZ30859.1 sodium/hydrogen exchanger [Xylanimonas cellulosilytica DSM 15894]